jgi:hypothetical protein
MIKDLENLKGCENDYKTIVFTAGNIKKIITLDSATCGRFTIMAGLDGFLFLFDSFFLIYPRSEKHNC